MKTLSKLQSYMSGRKLLLPASLFFSALSALAGMAPYIIVWFIIKMLLTSEGNFASVDALAWWAAGSAVASIFLYFFALSLSHLAAFRVEVNMRKQAMAKIVKMPLGFFDTITSGKIRKVIDDNAGITHSFLAHQMPDIAATIITPVAAFALIFIFDWRLGIACLVPILFSMVVMSSMMGKKGKGFMEKYMNSLEEMNTEAVEYVRGIPVVKVFQQTVFSFKNFHKSINNYKNMVFQFTRMFEKPMSAYQVVINGFAFLLVPVAIVLVAGSGNFTAVLVDLFLFMLVTPVFSQSIMRSQYLNQTAGQAGEAVNRIENISDFPLLSVPEKPEKIKSFNVRFSNVSYAYPGANNKALDGISFTIPEGKTVALVGASGSGKTTIARLLPRFRDVDAGSITIGGVDVKNADNEELMKNISFVFQNTRLFKTSLLENIKYGNPSARLEEVEQAVDMAQCRDIINKMPNGLNTKIGTEGTYLSGGEQQRIILARAMLKNAPIVILDEATAFTDPENEHLIQQAFKKLTKGKTVLMIAHRLTSVTDADTILVMNEGEIAEQGAHRDLMHRKGLYARMWIEYQQSIQWKIEKEVRDV